MTDEGAGVRMFNMQRGPNIPWWLAEVIYAAYSERYGKSQSLERLHERGGFSWKEVEFLYGEPATRYSRPGKVIMDEALAKALPKVSFQSGVSSWMEQCFLPSLYSNMTERGDRLLEEVLELLQSKGYDPQRVATLVDYVWNRPVGEPAQEVGGVMVTLAGYCWIAGLDMHAAGAAELARINKPEVMATIRAKQEAKNALHFDTPLPGATAAPEVVP
jgi:hypothetical protein